MKLSIINLDGKSVGDINVSKDVFGREVRADLLHRVVNWQLAKARQGSANTKTRSEINRTSKKWFRQKGTGNARHGSRRSNIFVGGATQFGPKPKDWSFNLPRKVRQLALKTAISSKVASKDIVVIDEAALKTHKTKDFIAKLDKLDLSSATFIVDAFDENFDKASRNVPHIKVLPTEGANVYDILRQDKLVLTKNAVALLEGRLTGEEAPAKADADKKPAAKKAAAKAPAKKAAAKKAPAKKAAPAKKTVKKEASE